MEDQQWQQEEISSHHQEQPCLHRESILLIDTVNQTNMDQLHLNPHMIDTEAQEVLPKRRIDMVLLEVSLLLKIDMEIQLNHMVVLNSPQYVHQQGTVRSHHTTPDKHLVYNKTL